MTIYSLMYYFSYLELVCCSMFSSNCCFLTCRVSQEADQVVWYSHLFQNFEQFVMIHTVKGFGIVNKAEIDVFFFFFWNSLPFSMIHQMLAIWSLVPLPFLKPAWASGISQFMWTWRILSITLLVCEMSAIVQQLEYSLSLPFFGIGMKTDLMNRCFQLHMLKKLAVQFWRKKKSF